MLHPELELQLHRQQGARAEEARRHRHPVPRARPPGRWRRALGRGLVHLGERLAGAPAPTTSRPPQRAAGVHATRGR